MKMYDDYVTHPFVIRFEASINICDHEQKILLFLSLDGVTPVAVENEDDATDFKKIAEARHVIKLLSIRDSHIYNTQTSQIIPH
jgi:hypothetical protein